MFGVFVEVIERFDSFFFVFFVDKLMRGFGDDERCGNEDGGYEKLKEDDKLVCLLISVCLCFLVVGEV